MLFNTNTLIISTILTWPGWSVIGVCAAVIYTAFTFFILRASIRSIQTQNKLVEFQIYSKICDTLDSEQVINLIEEIKRDNVFISYQDRTAVGKKEFAGAMINKLLLNPFEDLYKFWQDGLISIESIDIIGYKILIVGSNLEIVNYINYLRTNIYNSQTIYQGFEALFQEELKRCDVEEKSKFQNYFTPVIKKK